MLHKNRSNNRNQLKFFLILPALVVFLMSFNTKEIYIKKESNPKTVSPVLDLINFESSDVETYAIAKNTPPKTSKKTVNKTDLQKSSPTAKQDIATYFIESTFTDAQLDNIITKLKAQGVTLKIKGVKRNSDNKITALKIDAKSDRSNANFSIDNDSAIKTVRITYNAKDNSISIGNTNSLLHDKDYEYMHKDGVFTIEKSGKSDNVFVFSSDDEHEDEHEVIEEEGKIIIKSIGKVYEQKKANKDKNVFVISEGDKVIDLKGNEVKEGNYIIKKGKTIKEWKDEDGNIFIHSDDNDKEGKVIIKSSGNSFWTDDKEGKVIINKSDGSNTLWTTDNDENVLVETIGKDKNKIFISTGGKEDALFIVDGKEVAKKDYDVDPNNIASVNVLKGEAATKIYGDKGKNGVIVITTKNKKD